MIETVTITTGPRVSFLTKLNPIWWLHGPDGWDVPTENNGAPYLPEVKSMALRRFWWFGARNPLMNFVAYVIGVEDKSRTVYGPAPVVAVTWRDVVSDPPTYGFKWALISTGWSPGAAAVWALFIAWCLFTTSYVAFAFAFVVAFVTFFKAIGILPYASYWGNFLGLKNFEWYFGWRPHTGGFGWKSVTHDSDRPVIGGKVV